MPLEAWAEKLGLLDGNFQKVEDSALVIMLGSLNHCWKKTEKNSHQIKLVEDFRHFTVVFNDDDELTLCENCREKVSWSIQGYLAGLRVSNEEN